MCNAFREGTTQGRWNSYLDPVGAAIATGDKKKLDPLKVGLAKPVPVPPALPARPQEAKDPEISAAMLKRRNSNPSAMYQGSTMLTSPGAYGQPLIGKNTLLGG